jgi:hypothetical protein
LRRKIHKSPAKRDITVLINNALSAASNHLEARIDEAIPPQKTLVRKNQSQTIDNKEVKAKSARVLYEYAALLVESPLKHIEEELILPEEVVKIFLASALMIQMRFVDKISPTNVPTSGVLAHIYKELEKL